MIHDYFVAGRYRNKDNIIKLVREIRKRRKTAYSFAESPASLSHVGAAEADGEELMKDFENIPDWWNHPGVREIFETDMEAERNSENFILLLPAGKSAHLEAGVAYGLGKKCILIEEQKETESLYLIFSEHYDTPEEFLKSIESV